ncbi:MAG: CheR family methyltransferase [Promethearchaeota archaeon]
MEELKNITGLKLDQYQRKFLEKRIDFRMKNLSLDYCQDYITYIRQNPSEINHFLDKFTINYTYFFRNLSVFENFERFINLYCNQNNNNRTLHIWSAPCATGDEPYTIAMILDQLKSKNKNFPDFHIVASDIDPSALNIARKGLYGEYAVHEIPHVYLEQYFTKKDTKLGSQFILNTSIKEKVEFIQEDIIKGHQNHQKYDVIFCRNFFIYINQFAREKLLRILESRLYDGGLLVLGGSESIPKNCRCFESINMRDRLYIKNLPTQDISFRNSVPYLANVQKTSIEGREREKPINIRKLIPNTIEIKKIQEKTEIKENLKETSKFLDFPEKEVKIRKVNQKEIIQDLNELENIEAEVRITGIEVNSSYNGFLNGTKKNQLKESVKKDIENNKANNEYERRKELKQRELILEQREKIIEERIAYLDGKYKKIEKKRKDIDNTLKKIKKKEEEVKNRIEILERLTKQVEQREKLVEQKEKQFERRIRQVGDYTRQIVHNEVLINGKKNGEIENNLEFESFDTERLDRIDNPNKNKELVIPMGYYALINSFDKNETATKFIIQGLGSGIALIFKDAVNNIFAISHISLPSSSASKQGYHLLFPHTFVDTSVKDLYNFLIYNGANSASIEALIVGGAKLFLDYDMTYQENIDAVKRELEKMQISIVGEDTGGLSERAIIYDTINDSLHVKKTWEFEYRKIA